MMSHANGPVRRSTSVGFCSLLLLLFIALRLTHQINWPWMWVLSPAWIILALFVILVTGGAICAFAGKVLDTIRKRKRKVGRS